MNQNVSYKCLLCGRNKFLKPQPHRCNGQFRKRKLQWEEVKNKPITMEQNKEVNIGEEITRIKEKMAGKSLTEYFEETNKNQPAKIKVPCNNCQGGGCPTCGGFGYWEEEAEQVDAPQPPAQDVQEAAKEYAKREANNGTIPDMVANMIKLEQAVLYGASLTSRQLPTGKDKPFIIANFREVIDSECTDLVRVQMLNDIAARYYQLPSVEECVAKAKELSAPALLSSRMAFNIQELEQLIHYSHGKTK